MIWIVVYLAFFGNGMTWILGFGFCYQTCAKPQFCKLPDLFWRIFPFSAKICLLPKLVSRQRFLNFQSSSKLKSNISTKISNTKIKKIQSKIKFCFFVENNFIYQYLEPYIQRKKNDNTIIISLEKLNIKNQGKKKYVLKTMFFRNIFFLTHKIKFLITKYNIFIFINVIVIINFILWLNKIF